MKIKEVLRSILIGILALIGGFFTGLIVKGKNKNHAAEIVLNRARRQEFDIKSREAKKEVKRLTKEMTKLDKELVKKQFKERFGGNGG